MTLFWGHEASSIASYLDPRGPSQDPSCPDDWGRAALHKLPVWANFANCSKAPRSPKPVIWSVGSNLAFDGPNKQHSIIRPTSCETPSCGTTSCGISPIG